MDHRNIPWKAEWKAAGLDPGPLSDQEAALVDSLREQNQQFLLKHPFPQKLKMAKVPSKALPMVWSIPLVAAAALLFAIGLPLPVGEQGGSFLERIKGGEDAVLVVYRQGKGSAEKLNAGASIRPGDLLQAAYRVSQTTNGALLSLDGGGNVTVHLAQEGRSVVLTSGTEHRLEFSYELDRAPQYEVFFLFTSEKPFELEPIRQTLKGASSWRKLDASSFGNGVKVVILPLNKVLTP